MATRTAHLVAVTPGGDITDEMIAGYYSWFSIPEDLIPLAKVRKAFKDAGLDVDVLPNERRPEHVVQEACRRVERVEQNGHRVEIRAEQVDRNSTELVYQITRHVQDKANRVIDHPKALRVVYTFDGGRLGFEALDNAAMSDVQALADEIQDHVSKNATKMPGHKLRTIIRHYLEDAGAENMRGGSGGVYFLPKVNPIPTWNRLYKHHQNAIDGNWLLDAMMAVLTTIYGTKADMHKLPCVNDDGQRAYLKRKFMENCADDLKSFRDECVELVADKDKRVRGYRADLRDRLINQRAQMDARRAQFADILGETLDELDRDMKLADKALAKFISEAGV
jgi:hypothetical protein